MRVHVLIISFANDIYFKEVTELYNSSSSSIYYHKKFENSVEHNPYKIFGCNNMVIFCMFGGKYTVSLERILLVN